MTESPNTDPVNETSKVSNRRPTNPDFVRHQSWLDYDSNRPPIAIVGCGAVGSNVAMLFARLGFESFILFDGDVVEALNLPNQAFDSNSVGLLKTDALEEQLLRFSSNIKVEKRGLFTSETELPACNVFCGVDSFSGRKIVIDRCIALLQAGVDIGTFSDCRLGFNYGRGYIINFRASYALMLIEKYLNTIGSDAEVTELPCTQKICPGPVLFLCSAVTQVTAETIKFNDLNQEDQSFTHTWQIEFAMENGNIRAKAYPAVRL